MMFFFFCSAAGFMSFPVSLHNWCSSASLRWAAAGCGLGDAAGWVFGWMAESG